jgi:SAM-dependent methyltransferase
MGVWNRNGVSIGFQESMDGRAEVILSDVRKWILKRFATRDLSKLSVLDIGCHDGWLLNGISDFGFGRLIGIDPREKNIIKARVIREELHIDDQIELRVGDIHSVINERFDIVLCTGVLYHLESIPCFIRNLSRITKEATYLESRVVSSNFLTNQMQNQLEMNDAPYKKTKSKAGLSLHKFESAYSDGSTSHDAVVSLPTVETILMYLENYQFNNIEITSSAEEFRKSLKRKERPLVGVCLTAEKWQGQQRIDQVSDKNLAIAREIEVVYSSQFMDSSSYKYFERALLTKIFSWDLRIFLTRVWAEPNFHNNWFIKTIHKNFVERKFGSRRIIRDIKYSPRDKLVFEDAKRIYLADGNSEQALTLLHQLTRKPNSDWRTVFRSFSSSHRIYKELGEYEKAVKYRNYALSSNPLLDI